MFTTKVKWCSAFLLKRFSQDCLSDHKVIGCSLTEVATLYIVCKSPLTTLWWWVSCNGSPAGHLTPVFWYDFSVVWCKMAPPYSRVHRNVVVVSCGTEGVEGATRGGLFRQNSHWVRDRDACQLCKACLSPWVSLKKKKKAVIAQCRTCPSFCTSPPVHTTVSLVSVLLKNVTMFCFKSRFHLSRLVLFFNAYSISCLHCIVYM